MSVAPPLYEQTKDLLTDVAAAIKERDDLIAVQAKEIKRLSACIDQIETMVMDFLQERQAANRQALVARINEMLNAPSEQD